MRKVSSFKEMSNKMTVSVREGKREFFSTLPVKDFYTVEEVRQLFGLKDRHVVYRWVWEGKIQAFKEGGVLRIPRWDLLRFIRERCL